MMSTNTTIYLIVDTAALSRPRPRRMVRGGLFRPMIDGGGFVVGPPLWIGGGLADSKLQESNGRDDAFGPELDALLWLKEVRGTHSSVLTRASSRGGKKRGSPEPPPTIAATQGGKATSAVQAWWVQLGSCMSGCCKGAKRSASG